jgi:ATP-dependent helicase/nuclease subunit B
MQVAEASLEGLKQLIEQYAEPAQPYLQAARRIRRWSVSDYDRLARRAEWTTDEGEE